jgi:exodeoxyribonuclease V alpha subunit
MNSLMSEPSALVLTQSQTLDFFQQISHWPELGLIRALDLHTVQRLANHCQEQRAGVLLAALVSSYFLGQGHTCLPLTVLFDSPFQSINKKQWQACLEALGITSYQAVLTELINSPLIDVKTTNNTLDPVPSKPYVLEGDRLYLARYYGFECHVVNYIHQAQNRPHYEFEASWLDKLFDEDKTQNNNADIDWQKVSVANAGLQSFAVISGGPGTGKTTTVTKLLLLLALQANAKEQGLTIELAAPTGKAAARLTQSIIQAKAKLRQSTDFSDEVFTLIPEKASTLHRLLGSQYGRSGFRHNQKNPLHLDVLLVDEASMVDLPMMAKLLDALPAQARLILLGDKDQLASVEAGSVLADLTHGIEPVAFSSDWAQTLTQLTQTDLSSLVVQDGLTGKSIRQSLSLLKKSYRFHQDSGIGHLASAVNNGDASRSVSILRGAGERYPDLSWSQIEQDGQGLNIATLAKGYDAYWSSVKEVLHGKLSISALFQEFANYQILCAVRTGDYGVEVLNQALQAFFYNRGRMTNPLAWYSGKAIIITRNDASLGLFNGDIGICLPDAHEKERLRVWFELPDGSLKAYLPSRLSENEAVFVMTVHKSQGSEFKHVELVLPPYESPVLTKELIYTGITRAKTFFSLWASPESMRSGVETRVARYSGLIDKLWHH